MEIPMISILPDWCCGLSILIVTVIGTTIILYLKNRKNS